MGNHGVLTKIIGVNAYGAGLTVSSSIQRSGSLKA
jgi:hypothetical protein